MPAPRTLSPESVTAAARAELSAHGTEGLSLRGTARRLGVSAPALYHYFPKLDDLITAVILDVLSELRSALDAAAATAAGGPPGHRVLAICRAYRQWALAHPVDFQLAFAEPIPGYSPPQLISDEKAREPFLGLFAVVAEAYAAGTLVVPAEYERVPRSISRELRHWRRDAGIDLPDAIICVIVSGWVRIHGLVSLEMFGQSTGIVGDGGALFDYEVRAFLTRLCIPASGRTAS